MAKLLIKEIAEAQGLNRSRLQIKAGVTLPMLNRYWNNDTDSVHLASMDRIAQALGVQVRDLFAIEEPKREEEDVELEQEVLSLRNRLDLESRYHQDHQARGFKIWLKKQPGQSDFTKRLLSDDLLPPRGSRGTYEAHLRRLGCSPDDLREFEHLWKAMLLQS